jgi:hypothetical protein
MKDNFQRAGTIGRGFYAKPMPQQGKMTAAGDRQKFRQAPKQGKYLQFYKFCHLVLDLTEMYLQLRGFRFH